MSLQNRVIVVTQLVIVTVQDANDGGKMLGELVLVKVDGGVVKEGQTNLHGQAHFHLEPGEYWLELRPPERGTSKRIVIPAPQHELNVCLGIES